VRELKGKVAVVTGAASGIGLALAERFAAEGMKVVLADVEVEPLRRAESSLRSAGAEVLAVPTDVARADQVDRLAQQAREAFGGVHIVCNNAGVGATSGAAFWEMTRADWEWVLGVNLWGAINGMRAFVPILLEQEEGHVVNTASMAGLISVAYSGPYVMSKFAAAALKRVASSPGQKPPKYAAIMTAGKKVMCGTAFPSTGQSGHRINREPTVASKATPSLTRGPGREKYAFASTA